MITKINRMKRTFLLQLMSTILMLSIIGCEKNDVGSDATSNFKNQRNANVGSTSGFGCPVSTKLIMEKNGQNNNFNDIEGDVHVVTTADYVEFNYVCDPGFGLKSVTVWVGPKSKAPVNSAGHPMFGHFQAHVSNLGNVAQYTVRVPRSKIPVSRNISADPMIAIAHANVFGHNTESSYGKGKFFKPTGKAQYIDLTGSCGWVPFD
jgi:hypothetical protein